MSALSKTAHRAAEYFGAAFLSDERRIRLERRMRGYLESRRLERADAVVASFGKSGRTWLRVLLSRFYQQKHGLAPGVLIEFDNLHRMNREVPKIFFTHDNYLRDFTGDEGSKAAYRGKRVVLLVRDPRDVAVSQYFQWLHRMRPHKMLINRYPPPDADISMFEFVSGEAAGIPKVVRFLNEWAQAFQYLDHLLLVRYEDMRANTPMQLRRILDFIGTPGSEAEISDAVEYASFENMRKREQGESHASERLTAIDRDNPDSFKSRRGKVGGYHDYFSDEQASTIERLQFSQLDPAFGYRIDAPTTTESMSD